MTAPAVEPMDAMQRRDFVRLSAGSLASMAVGCTPRDTTVLRRSTLIIAYPGGGLHLNAVTSEDFKYLVFLPLAAENEHGVLEGILAERWEHSPDLLEWTVHLRRDLHWHDGRPVTADDVKFTVDLFTHPDVLELTPDDIESVAVVDAWTLIFRFHRLGGARFITSGYDVVLPKHLLQALEPKSYSEWTFWDHPVGCGPYRFARYLPGTMMEFDASPGSASSRPHISHVVLKFVADAGLAELVSGNVDILLGANPAQSSFDPSFRAYYGIVGQQVHGAIFWQTTHPLLQDSRVRRALTLAIDRRELLQLLNLPSSLPILDGPFTWRLAQNGALDTPLPYDPEQAGALLDAAGWRRAPGADVRGRNGVTGRFTLLVGRGPGFGQIAVYVQQALRRIGIGMDIETMEPSLVKRRASEGRFDAVLQPIVGAASVWLNWFGEQSPLGYRNAEVVRLLERKPLAETEEEKDDICRRLTDIFRAEVPATFLFPKMATVFARRRVRGLSTPWQADPLRNIDRVWLAPEG